MLDISCDSSARQMIHMKCQALFSRQWFVVHFLCAKDLTAVLHFHDYFYFVGVLLRGRKKFNFLWMVDFPLFLPKEDGTGKNMDEYHKYFKI